MTLYMALYVESGMTLAINIHSSIQGEGGSIQCMCGIFSLQYTCTTDRIVGNFHGCKFLSACKHRQQCF